MCCIPGEIKNIGKSKVDDENLWCECRYIVCSVIKKVKYQSKVRILSKMATSKAILQEAGGLCNFFTIWWFSQKIITVSTNVSAVIFSGRKKNL